MKGFVTLSSSFTIDTTQGMSDEMLADVKEMVRDQIRTMLREAGRTTEVIYWVEGPFIMGKDWPLDTRFGPGDFHKILGHCDVLSRQVKNKELG
jgi:hypothetical protein